MRYFLFLPSLFILSACTYSVTMAHTEGTATDIIDETSSNTPSTSLSIPTI